MSLLNASVVADMAAKSPGGLLVVEEQNRTFVISFGHAWQKLEQEQVESANCRYFRSLATAPSSVSGDAFPNDQ